MAPRADAKPKGIRDIRDAAGAVIAHQAYIRVRGRFCSKSFPKGTGLLVMRRWREEQRVRVRLGAELPTGEQPFEQDCKDYLASVAAMPSIADRQLHIGEWARIFAGRQRNGITALEVKTELERLRKKYAASSVDKRRTALMSLFTALNGKSGYNPVRDVPKYSSANDWIPRAQSPMTVYRILALMRPSKTRARLRLMFWTGLPQTQIAQLRPEHVDESRKLIYVTPRRKGKGHAGAWLPLLPGARVALADMATQRAFGSFSTSAMHKAFSLAVGRFNARREAYGHFPVKVRPYDLRHSFGTMLATRTTDQLAIQTMMLHSRAEQTRRYTDSATSARVASAVDLVASQLHRPTRS